MIDKAELNMHNFFHLFFMFTLVFFNNVNAQYLNTGYSAMEIAQISNIDDLTPIDGVEILKNQIVLASAGDTFKDCDKCPTMVVIPAGNFLMGASKDDSRPDKNELPRHQVDIPMFALGKYEVTVSEWKEIMGEPPGGDTFAFISIDPQSAIGNITWENAQIYLRKLSSKTGRNYRLPSEAEWEYAARAGTDSIYFWGNDRSQSSLYFSRRDNFKPVCRVEANQFGICDMYGSVWEWTQDCMNDSFFGAPTDGSAWLSGQCNFRVVRGVGNIIPSTSSERFFLPPKYDSQALGFRVAAQL
jgi:formylglycine-generating enzyme required for sulfatase activity